MVKHDEGPLFVGKVPMEVLYSYLLQITWQQVVMWCIVSKSWSFMSESCEKRMRCVDPTGKTRESF